MEHLPLVAVLAALHLAILYIMGFFGSKNYFDVNGRTAIVTGGSQGMGLSVAKKLASKGANVVIVARDTMKLRSAIQEISKHAKLKSQRFDYLSYDLCSSTSAPQIVLEVAKKNEGQPPDVLFCCAGFCEPGFFASTSLDTHRSQMDTIYWSCAYMAHAMLNAWTSVKSEPSPPAARHIVFTSSTLAFIPIAGYAPYTPAKAAMRALADTLNQEVAVYNGARPGSEIKIHTVFPMGILSPGYENEQKSKPQLTIMLEKDDKPQTSDEVARIAIERLEAGDNMITTMFVGHLLRGVGMGASVRNGLTDIFWNLLGSIAILFVLPDFLSKCRKWGKEKGMSGAR